MYRNVELAQIALPDFGLPTVEPVLPAELYRARIERLVERARSEGCDVFVVYGDREHFPNLAYLTGYDPRFEEALLIIDLKRYGERKPLLLVGNEGLGYARISPILDDLEVELYQTMSLLGQDRSQSRPLADILRAGGVGPGTQVGVAGWKYFSPGETPDPSGWIEIPAYIVDTLRQLAGQPDLIRNAGHLLMDASAGMRAVNEVEQLASFEFTYLFRG